MRGEHFVRPDIVKERFLNGLNLLSHYLLIPDKVQFFDTAAQNRLIAEIQNRELLIVTEKIPLWFKQYILDKLQETSLNKKGVTLPETVEALRLLYQKTKK